MKGGDTAKEKADDLIKKEDASVEPVLLEMDNNYYVVPIDHMFDIPVCSLALTSWVTIVFIF